MAMSKKDYEDIAKSINEATRSMNQMAKVVKEVTSEFSDTNDNLSDMSKRIKKIDDGLKKVSKDAKGIDFGEGITKDSLKRISEYANKTKRLRDLIGRINAMKGIVDDASLQKEMKLVNQLQKEVEDLNASVKKQGSIGAQAFSEMGGGMSHFMNMFSSFRKGPSAMLDSAKAANEYASNLKGAGAAIGKMPGLLGSVGKAAKGLGGALGGVSKIFMGWPGLIAGAIGAMVKGAMAVEEFVKNANKAFASMRGPDIMTGDIRKQFKEFNDQIFDISDNLQVGLNVDSIRAFMEAVSQAGLRITTLNEGLQDYRSAIYVAAKASRTLGLELPQVGSMIAELTTDFRMRLNDIDEAFVEVAFQAKKSGLSTDRFWNAVENATDGLAMYGMFVKQATKLVAQFNKEQMVGAQEAEAAASDVMKAFKDASLTQKSTMIAFAKNAGFNFNDAFKEAAGKFQMKAEEIGTEITVLEAKRAGVEKGSPAEKELISQIERLREEQLTATNKARRATEMIGKRSVYQARELAMLTGEAPEIIMAALSRYGNLANMSDQRMTALLESVEQTLGISADTARLLVERVKRQNILVRDQMGINKEGKQISGGILEKLDLIANQAPQNTEALQSTLKSLSEAQAKNDVDATQMMIGALSADLQKTLGINEQQANFLSEAAAANKDVKSQLGNIAVAMQSGNEKQIDAAKKELERLSKQGKIAESMSKEVLEEEEASTEAQKKAAEQTFKEIRNQTMTAREAMEIAKDGAKWQGAMLINMTRLTDMVGTLVTHFTGEQPVDPETQRANEILSSLNIKAESQVEKLGTLIQKQDMIEDLTDKIEKQEKDRKEKLRELGKTTDKAAQEQITAEIKAIDEQMEQDKRALEEAKSAAEALEFLTRNAKKERMFEMKGMMADEKERVKLGKMLGEFKGAGGRITDESLRQISEELGGDTMAAFGKTAGGQKKVIEDLIREAERATGRAIIPTRAAGGGTERAPMIGDLSGRDLSGMSEQQKAEAIFGGGSTFHDGGFITQGGAAAVEPGELIIPESMASQVAPLVGAAGSPIGGGGMGAPVNITIRGNSFYGPDDLRKSIENTVRNINYKQLLGVG